MEGVDEMVSALESEDGQKVVKAAVSSAERLARRFEALSEGLDDAARIHPVIAGASNRSLPLLLVSPFEL